MSSIVTTVYFPGQPVVVGRIGGVYGVLGWVKIISFTDKISNIFHYNPWFIFFQDRWQLIRLECWQLRQKKCCIAKIFGIKNRESAMLLMNCDLVIDDSQLPNLYNNEYYWKDIIGCKVINTNGNSLGYVSDIMETIAHDILVIRPMNSDFSKIAKIDCLIPFVYNKVIKTIDLDNHVILVDWDYDY